MSTLVFQIHIKQWDKSQRSLEDEATRQLIATTYQIQTTPEFFILDSKCIIDRHGKSEHERKRPLKTLMLKDGSVQLERFIIKKDDDKVILQYQNEQAEVVKLGCLNDGWIQAAYTSRKRVNQHDQIFWLYEAFTLNTAFVKSFESDYFLTENPQRTYNFED